MLRFWLWFCLVVVVLLCVLGMESGKEADQGELSGTYGAISCGSFGCGGLLILTIIALLWWLKS
jgi:hypothetical protein